MAKLIPVLHNVTSAQKLIDFAKLVFSLNINYLVATKVGGVASNVGVPEVNKLAFKLGKTFISLPDLKDAIELLSPDLVILLTSQAQKILETQVFNDKNKIMLVFSGIENGFSKIDLSLGENYKLRNIDVEISPIASIAVIHSCILHEEFKNG
ncbi:RecB-family nuclease [Sulfolobus acidocaldarius]|uniref:Conserved Archaeal protein n=4 Tax=Sulfolobus acidocaldarius TaxID=2285 RepID=Q4JAZ5_SULAC|nr:RecB-family nuclease [Sulfolobus acidocaldarius]AAY80034.1 conserved Archaeal protein [Sulfolobus acidocaldarius DSM 639]AGE70605.1 hypothetical protein SacN8_03140 [Sulfolobus acidocaldarius N8]AGE72878.1 hypothetical protein SacRon12I_03130 [Sulfolobus acidocaldarius Ron12/I]ALU29042.1 exonuclease [Sulfolobus acidocaldarius]ALU31768.1 exonuclease [Sulfolobus acidocaldarius]